MRGPSETRYIFSEVAATGKSKLESNEMRTQTKRRKTHDEEHIMRSRLDTEYPKTWV